MMGFDPMVTEYRVRNRHQTIGPHLYLVAWIDLRCQCF